MKINNACSAFIAMTAAMLLSTGTLHATTHASALFRTDSESNVSIKLHTQTLADIKLPRLNQNYSSDIPVIRRIFINDLKPVSSPAVSSTSPDGNNIRDNLSMEKITSEPEPGTLLLLGTGMMGVALYRRLKTNRHINK
ncbi:MAG TPA: hypothetical protein DDX85_13960 [Nitrospiraceae bacterium]|nr:hypothetical protein [Nitrospiraceae bacterium]